MYMSETTSNIELFQKIVEAPGWKSVLKRLSTDCKKDGKSRLMVALELYLGLRHDACLKCKVAEKPVATLLTLGGSAFGATKESMKERFMDPFWRRGLENVVKGVGAFGVTRPFVPGAPFQVVWNITSSCNLKCKHCYANAGSSAQEDVSTEQAKLCIDKLANWGVVVLAFSGGEPLVRRDIMELIKHSADHDIFTAVATNGVLLTKDKCRELKEAGAGYLQISLDGAKAETHDSFRGVEGMYDRTIEGIKNAVAEGFFVNVATTVTQFNLAEIPEIIALDEKLGAQCSMLYNFIPTGRATSIESVDLSPDQREDLLKMVWKLMNNSKIEVLSTAPQFARVAVQTEGSSCTVFPTHFMNSKLPGQLQSLSNFIGGCGAGRFYVAMNTNGDITPCVFFPYVIGNVFKDDLDEMWRKNISLLQLRDRDQLKAHCGVCEYKYVCGGCRARAYGYFKDFTQPDPGCILNRSVYEGMVVNSELVPESSK
jgi:radical SAM protein with 4Fe4S-binding SPASM domain